MATYEKIQTLCEKKDITITELERNTGISRGVIRTWKDNTPSAVDRIAKIANYFNVSADYLLGFSESPIPINNNSDYDFKDLQIIEKYNNLLDSDKQIIDNLLNSLLEKIKPQSEITNDKIFDLLKELNSQIVAYGGSGVKTISESSNTNELLDQFQKLNDNN